MAKSSVDKTPLPLVRDFGLIANLVNEGVVFRTGNVTAQTGITGQTSHALTLATVYLRNLGGKAMLPLWAQFSQVGTVAGARIFFSVHTLDTDQFTSATALTVSSANRRALKSSQVSAQHTATLPTFTAGNNLTVHEGGIFQSVSGVVTADSHELLPAPGCCIVKPGGGFIIYTNAGTTGPTWSFSIGWAELEV